MDKPKPRSQPGDCEDEAALFAREMADVVVYQREAARARRGVEARAPVETSKAIEVAAQLDDLVSGRAEFDLSVSEEHVEGRAIGVNRRLLKKLKRGDFSVHAHLDLHGRTRTEARELVECFLHQSRSQGHRCVLIIHGRGHHSKDHVPVLKESLGTWLVRGRMARWVLAFCSARPSDGGMGAVYVLLRR